VSENAAGSSRETVASPYDWCGERPGYEIFKRLIDVTVAATTLVVLSPLWLTIAIAIRLTSPGPALFRRTVVGRRGESFTYFKFRTMVVGDDSIHRRWLRDYVLRDHPYTGDSYKVTNDSRITSIGRLLRGTSLDEAPQLINVLSGDMSIVGPRPPIEFEFNLYDDSAKRRLAVKPGITGLYQVTARGRASFSRMLSIDLEYIARRSVLLDVAIMARTATAMFSGA
jgi:lipopolysaccharide/colanic/teichoic acid biosynthesis glycosyltransferase